MPNKQILLILMLIFYSCDCKKEDSHEIKTDANTHATEFQTSDGNKIDEERFRMSDLFYKAYKIRNGERFPEICMRINDSLLQREHGCLLDVAYLIKEKNRKIPVFSQHDYDFSYNMPDFILWINIVNSDTVYIDERHYCMSKLKTKLGTYIYDPKKVNRNIKHQEIFIPHLGLVVICKTMPLLNLTLTNDKELDIPKWRAYFELLHTIISLYKDAQDNISTNKWNLEYRFLSEERKDLVRKIVDFRFFLYVNIKK